MKILNPFSPWYPPCGCYDVPTTPWIFWIHFLRKNCFLWDWKG